MYIQNRRDSSKFKGCSPLQFCNGLIVLKSAIAYLHILTVVGHLTGPLSYKISSYRIEFIGYLSNINESYRIRLEF